MIISQRDLQRMELDIADTIKDWHTTAVIRIPKPLDQQTNWNKRLREFNGDILYDDYTVPVERIDGYASKRDVDMAGDRFEGSVTLYIPTKVSIQVVDANGPHEEMIDLPLSIYDHDSVVIVLDDLDWRIESVKKLIGEYFININRTIG